MKILYALSVKEDQHKNVSNYTCLSEHIPSFRFTIIATVGMSITEVSKLHRTELMTEVLMVVTACVKASEMGKLESYCQYISLSKA